MGDRQTPSRLATHRIGPICTQSQTWISAAPIRLDSRIPYQRPPGIPTPGLRSATSGKWAGPDAPVITWSCDGGFG